MNDLFRMGPVMLGPAFLGAQDSSRRPNWGETRWDEERENAVVYCDPSVDPDCPRAWISGDGNRSFQAEPTSRETPPTEHCNPAWDPACPRPLPQRTMVPYLPSSYMGARGTGRETPPTERCNPAWDPACPRPLPQRTTAPYLPSSYLMGVVYSVSDFKPRPRDRSGRLY